MPAGFWRKEMKYRKGAKVKIKTWNQMLSEFGTRGPHNHDNIRIDPYGFCKEMEDSLQGKSRFATIAKIGSNYYFVKLKGRRKVWRGRSREWDFYLTDEMLIGRSK